ncbi:histidine phosphatase family protein [Microbacter sp. GSS18]|nr:histidine phosphatase family protein [Microbacter sp. GSS18]
MTSLFLIRHGETDWNRDRRIQGATDIPLNDTGRDQARLAAAELEERLDRRHPVGVVSSDLSRARETAGIIAERLALPAPAAYPALRERSYGEAEGMQIEEFHHRFGASHRGGVPGAEEPADLRVRALGALDAVVADLRRATSPGPATLVVVSHGALIRELIGHASGGELPLEGERLANGSIHELLYERDRVRLLSYDPIAA